MFGEILMRGIAEMFMMAIWIVVKVFGLIITVISHWFASRSMNQ